MAFAGTACLRTGRTPSSIGAAESLSGRLTGSGVRMAKCTGRYIRIFRMMNKSQYTLSLSLSLSLSLMTIRFLPNALLHMKCSKIHILFLLSTDECTRAPTTNAAWLCSSIRDLRSWDTLRSQRKFGTRATRLTSRSDGEAPARRKTRSARRGKSYC